MSGGMLESTYIGSQESIVKFAGIYKAGWCHIDSSKLDMMEHLHHSTKTDGYHTQGFLSPPWVLAVEHLHAEYAWTASRQVGATTGYYRLYHSKDMLDSGCGESKPHTSGAHATKVCFMLQGGSLEASVRLGHWGTMSDKGAIISIRGSGLTRWEKSDQQSRPSFPMLGLQRNTSHFPTTPSGQN